MQTTASVLEWYDRHRAYIWFQRKRSEFMIFFCLFYLFICLFIIFVYLGKNVDDQPWYKNVTRHAATNEIEQNMQVHLRILF